MTDAAVPAGPDAGADAPPAPAGPPRLSRAQITALSVLGAGSVALAVMAFKGMFATVRTAMIPSFHANAWMIPVGTDTGIVLSGLFDLFLEWAGMRLWWVRWATLTFLGLQLGLNVGAAHGWLSIGGHLVLPTLFIMIIHIWLHTVRKRRALAEPDAGRVPWRRYLSDFSGSRECARLMHQWGISYAAALGMLQRQRLLYAHLQVVYGEAWRTRTSPDLIVMLHTPGLIDDAGKKITKLRERFDKGELPADHRRQRIANDAPRLIPNSGANGNSAPNASNSGIRGCCLAHTVLDNRKADMNYPPLPIARAAEVNARHIKVHGGAIGAESLQKIFGIGMTPARQLRDNLKAGRQPARQSGPQSGAESGRESGPQSGGESGPVSGSESGPAERVNGTPVSAGGRL